MTKRGITITSHLQIYDISDPHIYDTQEALILLLKFLLVEYLDRKDAIFIDSPGSRSDQLASQIATSGQQQDPKSERQGHTDQTSHSNMDSASS